MNIARVAYKGALRGAGELVLPERGVVLIVGPNAAGKSSFVEAVAVAAWGQTLRDARPWRKDEAAHIELATYDGATIERSRSKAGSQKLRFTYVGADEQQAVYETVTKAQAALEARIGRFDLWRRSNVFVGADAEHLSLATDAERKRLLEGMLGLEAFDAALLACREDVAAAAQEEVALGATARGAEYARERAEERAAKVRSELQELEEGVGFSANGDEIAAELEAVWTLGGCSSATARADETAEFMAQLAGAIEEEAEMWRDASAALGQEAHGYAVRARLELSRAARLEAGVCTECEQVVPATSAALLRDAGRRLERLASSAKKRAMALDLIYVATRRERREATRQRELYIHQSREILRALNDQEVRHERKADLEAAMIAANRELVSAENWERDTDKKHQCAQSRLEELRAIAEVLGLKGPRTTVLAGALRGVTAGANAWLDRIGGGIQIELRPYTETRSGGTNGAIEIKVFGAGGGEGYKACCSGERRRIDVALLFGVGEVAAAARGGRRSTMWCDELLTHLDEDGIAGAVEAIREVARDRCVVVIEQERSISVDMLRPDHIIRLKRG